MKSTVLVLATVVAASVVPVSAQDAKAAARGAALYAEQKCSVCHAVAGKGNAKHPLDTVGKTSTAEMIKLWLTDPKAAETKSGKKAMPPMKSYASLPAADIDALVAYMLSLK
jgi:mono/diheme cytochrome c family protein